jgi:hypothetical protein
MATDGGLSGLCLALRFQVTNTNKKKATEMNPTNNQRPTLPASPPVGALAQAEGA